MTTVERIPVVKPANDVHGPGQGRWTYTEYASLPDDGQRYEILNGVLYMAPSPNGKHQDVAGEIFFYLRNHVKVNGLGLVRLAPFDVKLTPDDVVQPDVFVVLNEPSSRIAEKHIEGAPDLVIEIASPSTATYDRHNKLLAYARAEVPEYWIVDPEARTVEVLTLEARDVYQSLGVFRGKTTLPSEVLPDFSIQVEQFFYKINSPAFKMPCGSHCAFRPRMISNVSGL
jgi:Uma2 family endonuclease